MGTNYGDDHIIMNNNVCNQRSNSNGCQWTNERHSNFLSLMEASFVRTMFEKKCVNKNENTIVDINNNMSSNSRLDRFVPDIAESTLDLQSRKFTTPVMSVGSNQRQRPQARPCKSSLDQVVPQIKDRVGETPY